MPLSQNLIAADWPAPPTVKAFTTTRHGGISQAPYNDLNLGDHVGDKIDHVSQNRQILQYVTGLPSSPLWLSQVHGTTVTRPQLWHSGIEADAIYSDHPQTVCCVLTADCLPVLLCDASGQQVAAIHAGWRGLLNGIIEKTVNQFSGDKSKLFAWLGPAIGPQRFEVGEEVFNAFVQVDSHAQQAFIQTDPAHYLANIYQLAQQRLTMAGVAQIYGGQYCTVSQPELFFSYRRDNQTGRMASIIWIDNK